VRRQAVRDGRPESRWKAGWLACAFSSLPSLPIRSREENKSLLHNDLRRLPPCPPSSPKIPSPKSTQASSLKHPFLPAHPAYQKLGGKVSLSYTMTYEGFLPAPPAPRKFLSLNRRKPAPLSTSSFFASLNYEEAGGAGRIAS
jgi:hypothetical protein